MKIWYTIEKNSHGYTVWKNNEEFYKNHGGCGSSNIYTGRTKQECIKYCKQNNIKINDNRKESEEK